MAPLIKPTAASCDRRRDLRDSLVVSIGGQLERALGTISALLLRWGLDPARLGVYTGLRLSLDQTNRSSLGIGLGAVQEIPILRASGRHDEARRIADVAFTTNMLTCGVYALGLLAWAWMRAPYLRHDRLADEWTWGLASVAGLTLLKRYESFLIAMLRAHREFVLTTELDLFESVISAAALASGLALAGFWGVLGAVGVILILKILYLHARHPLRFSWVWDLALAARLMKLGLPILANTAVFAALLSVDRALILWRLPDGAHSVGLYTIALMGTSWSLDLAGRLVLVLYTSLQTTLGRTGDALVVARQAARATEAQATPLAAGSAIACVVGPWFLGSLMPRYVEGLPALRPLLPGMTLLGMAWPARQCLIAIGRPYRLCLGTSLGLACTTLTALLGADQAGIAGVAAGMSVGYVIVYIITSSTAFLPALGLRGWLVHQVRIAATLGYFTAAQGWPCAYQRP